MTLILAAGGGDPPWWISLPAGLLVVGFVGWWWIDGKIMLRRDHDEQMAAKEALLVASEARAEGYKTAWETTSQAHAIAEANNTKLIESSKTVVQLIEALRESMGRPR